MATMHRIRWRLSFNLSMFLTYAHIPAVAATTGAISTISFRRLWRNSLKRNDGRLADVYHPKAALLGPVSDRLSSTCLVELEERL
jgi:hypothetical protein